MLAVVHSTVGVTHASMAIYNAYAGRNPVFIISGNTIDASGKLPGGVQFQGPAGLKKLLLANYRDQFEDTATEKLLTYALGRGLEYYDKPSVRSIMRQAERDNYRMSALIIAIVKSTPFQMRRALE